MHQYHLTDLGELPNGTYDQSTAVAINNAGLVTGSWYSFDGTVHSRAFVGSKQMMPIGIGAIDGHKSRANDINASGTVLGGHWKVETPLSTHNGVFLYDSSNQANIDITPFIAQSINFDAIYPEAINKDGVIIGNIVTPDEPTFRAFRFDTKNNQFDIIPCPDFVTDINGNNIVVGGGISAYYFDGAVHQINGSANGIASAINEGNWVVGETDEEAFLFDINTKTLKKLQTLEGPYTLGGPDSSAYAVNSHRDVVGQSTLNEQYTAFIYRDSTYGPMHNLKNFVIDADGWHLTAATGINDSGSIVGYGSINYGKERAFLLTPMPKGPPQPDFTKRFDAVAQILFGIIQDGGGGEFVGPHFKRIPPWGPPELDIMLGVACHRIANLVSSKQGVALQKAAMDMITKVAQEELKRLAEGKGTGPA